MKKIIISLMLLAAVLMLAAMPALAEDLLGEAAPAVELPTEGWVAEAIDGAVWQDGRAALEVMPEEDCFRVLITWGSSAWETTVWTYTCSYDAETQVLNAEHVICTNLVTDEENNESREIVLDEDCETVFSLDEEGRVVIRNALDEQLEGKTFTKLELEDPVSEDEMV